MPRSFKRKTNKTTDVTRVSSREIEYVLNCENDFQSFKIIFQSMFNVNRRITIPGSPWSMEVISRNMTLWRHTGWPSHPDYDCHITVVFRDHFGTVQQCPVDHHSTFFHRQRNSKWHYGWVYGYWTEEKESPEIEKMMTLFEQFRQDRSQFYSQSIIARMYS